MFIRERKPAEQDIKTGFAVFPVVARNGTVWLERYKLTRLWDWQHRCWINDRIEVLTTASTGQKQVKRMLGCKNSQIPEYYYMDLLRK